MSELPPGWRWSTVAGAGLVDLGRQRHPDWHHGPNMKPYLRVANVFEDRIDASDLKEMDFSGVFDRYKLHPGDVLLNEGQTPELLGRPAIYRGQPAEVAFTNSLIRFRAGPEVLPEWALVVFRHYMHAGRFARESRITTNIAHLSVTRFKSVEFPIPPMAEQQRIVEILEDHLSRLDAGAGGVCLCKRRLDALQSAVWESAIWGPKWSTAPVAQLLREPMRNGRSDRAAKGNVGTRAVRTLTLTAVTRGDFSERHTKITVTTPAQAQGLWLEPGDIFVQRANTPELVGTAARYVGPSNWAIFPDLLIRLRPNEDVVNGQFVLAALTSDRIRRSLRARAKGLAGSMPKIDQSIVGATEIPVPCLEEQDQVVKQLDSVTAGVAELRQGLAYAEQRVAALRRALLAAAFSGKLTGRHTDAEVVD